MQLTYNGPGLCRVEIHFTGRAWIELDGSGRDRTGHPWIDWTALKWTGLHRTGLDYTSVDGTGLDWTALHFTGLDCLSLTTLYCTPPDWSAPNCIARLQMKLNKTVLYCTWMYSTGLDHTAELCTALDVTWKDCSGLPKLQWSWWHYIKQHLTCMQKTTNKDW